MKKLISLLITIMIMTAIFSALTVDAAASDFTVEGGVLVKYSGSDPTVTVPDGIYSIGESAFEGNRNIKKLVLPSTVYSIGDRAFYDCTSLTTVIGSSVSSVGVMSFNGTPFFENSTDEFFKLGSCLLWYNGNAKKVALPSEIVSIAPYAFLRCDTITSFSAPSGLISVGDCAFCYCSNLASVSLPTTVSYIGAAAFEGTSFLSKAAGFVVLGDGILVKCSSGAASPAIPENVRRIAAGAFYNDTALTSIEIPSNVYSIDRNAFDSCTKLSSVTFNKGLVYIGDSAFNNCTSLKAVETPSTLNYIGDSVFSGCKAMTAAFLRGSSLTVYAKAFSSCTALRFALLSSGVSELGDYAFDGCTALEGISVSPDTLIIGKKPLNNCKKASVYCDADSFAASALSAYPVKPEKGDIDGDGGMTILDATRIQRYLADMVTLNSRAVCVSDMDYDAFVSVLDVTRIQRILAGLA